MDKDIPETARDIGDPPAVLADPMSCHPARPPPPKHIHIGAPSEAKPIIFIPPAVKAMSSSSVYTSSYASSRNLILNDYFHIMLDYKAKHNQFPSTYDDMIVFILRYISTFISIYFS